MMTAEQTLPASLYLLAYDTTKNELAKKAWLDYLVRGAVLCELIIRGYLVEVGRRPRAMAVNGHGTSRPADPMLSLVLDELRQDPGLTWRRLLRQDATQSLAAVEQQLAHERLISAGPGGSVTGPVAAADPAAVESMQESVRAALTGQVDPAALPARDAALAALAAVVPLPTVISRREVRRHADVLAALGDRAAEQRPALRSLIAQMRRTRGRSFSAGGPVR
jgi:Golgi phosphoprotein 3 (GPP34)